ncbi:MAG TPA: glycosyltransferase [Acidimicrobiia bacterium]|nr:glycosyltransferase [Acidimicrobiia bacterium]
MTAIHQFLPTLAPRDAVGAHALAVRDTLRGAGYESEIFALEAKEHLRREARDYRKFSPRNGTWLLYQMSIGSPVCDFVVNRPEPLIVNYHNVTPRRFFAQWEPVVARNLALGRDQLHALAARAELGVAVSHFNERDLVETGFRRTAVAPVIVELDALRADADPALVERLRCGTSGGRWLFVGRIAPNKAQHELVRAFAVYRDLFDSHAQLTLVGGLSSAAYELALRTTVSELGLDDAVVFAGAATREELSAHYRAADVFVICSEHEGFCVPLLEAMAHDLPIVACANGGVGETMGDAGVVLDTADPLTLATAVDRVIGDEQLQSQLITAGRARLRDFNPDRARATFLDAISAVVS